MLIILRWRRFRRPTVDGFSKTAVQHFRPIQSREAIMLALALMKNSPSPQQFQRHTWSALLSMTYNHPPAESGDDPVIAGVANFILRMMHEIQPGMRLIEFFPWFKYIPSWCARSLNDRGFFSSKLAGSRSGNGTHNTGLSKTR